MRAMVGTRAPFVSAKAAGSLVDGAGRGLLVTVEIVVDESRVRGVKRRDASDLEGAKGF